MKIALDLATAYGDVDGIGVYIRGLTHALLDTQTDVTVIPIFGCLPSSRKMWVPDHPNVSRRPTLMPRRFYSTLINNGFPLELSTGKVDVVHWPNYCSYNTFRAKIVVTIHDLAFLEYPDFYPAASRKHYSELIKHTLDRADHIVANSEHTAWALVSYFGWPREQVTCTYLGGAEIADLDCDDLPIPDDHSDFIVSIGSHVPRKNLGILINAFEQVYRNMPGRNLKLLIIGQHGEITPQLIAQSEELGIAKNIFWLGYVSNEVKAGMIKRAKALVHTSLHEGFGLPIVEAMACGTPVLYPNVAACPEVGGDAGIACDPRDPSSYAQALIRLLEDSGRDQRVAAGLARAKMFTWKECASRTRAIYDKLV